MREIGSLNFMYGTVGSAKTNAALKQANFYRQHGMKVCLAKPSKDTRFGSHMMQSRTGLKHECYTLEELLANCPLSNDVIIVDEIQFATIEQVDALARIADKEKINIYCYGLKTDFRGELFEGSKRMLEIADNFTEIKSTCWCGQKAIMTARYDENGITRNGEQMLLSEKGDYVSLCREHYNEGHLSEDYVKPFDVKNFFIYDELFDCKYGSDAKLELEQVQKFCLNGGCKYKVCSICSDNQTKSMLEKLKAALAEKQTTDEAAATIIAGAMMKKLASEENRANEDKTNRYLLLQACHVKANKVFKSKQDIVPIGRIVGEEHCYCNGNGEFVLIPKSSPNEKQYMRCRKCGCYTH